MREESIFADALLIAGAERAAYLDRASGGDTDLRRQVEALLAAHAASNVLDHPAVGMVHTGPYAPATGEERPDMVVGPYKTFMDGVFDLLDATPREEPKR